jgi:hypothetical protein
VNIKGTNSMEQCTVMLGNSLAGGKMPPFIIFKDVNTRMVHVCKELEKGEGYPHDMEYKRKHGWTKK